MKNCSILGAFGTVCMGTAYGVEGYIGPTTVAVKQLKANADENEKREFLAEMDIMKQVIILIQFY